MIFIFMHILAFLGAMVTMPGISFIIMIGSVAD